MACRSQTILSSLFQGRSTFKPAPVKEKSSIRQVPSAILPILNYRDPLYQELRWVTPAQARDLPFLPADADLVAGLPARAPR